MCGITGFIEYQGGSSAQALKARVLKMSKTLHHRGPDDSGVWVEPASAVAFGHTRLSIQDISSLGHQPMISRSQRYVITYNGEIYNFLDLRAELLKLQHAFRGNSDTEVALAAIEQWGLEAALKKFTGMFALAVWDRRDKSLYLARDRIGEKPLYYGWLGSTFAFASELKALRTHPDWDNTIDRNSLSLFLRHKYIPTPYCIYEYINKLQPGAFLHLQGNRPNAEPIFYWRAQSIMQQSRVTNSSLHEMEQIDRLEHLLRKTIANKMIADVPLGAFLSGGIDSSTVVAVMQSLSEKPVNTYTIGFHDQAYNEADLAGKVARHLGASHTELYVSPEEAREVIPKLPILYDEPFADSSQIPTYLVSALAREHVTVALSGDGGDELFGGYNRYFYTQALWEKFNVIPKPLRVVMMRSAKGISAAMWNKIFKIISPVLPENRRHQRFGEGIHKLAEAWGSSNPSDLYFHFISHWKSPDDIVLGGKEPQTALHDMMAEPSVSHLMEKMMYWDLMTYLPDDILTKVDRASMGVGLEVRVPYLDHHIVEFALSLPVAIKIRKVRGKYILRQVLKRYVPETLTNHPKMGFGVPIDTWLCGSLRDWCEELLSERRLMQEGYFEPAPIRKMWEEHKSGTRTWHYYLWDILMFQAWLEHQNV